MGHRLSSSVAVAASILSICATCTLPTLVAGNVAQAKPSKGSGALTKPRAAGKPAAAGPAAAPTPPPIKRIAVCVRPKDIDEKINEWTFSETNRPVVKDVEATARRLGNRIYFFDEKAHFDSPRSQPAAYGQAKCPKDDRKPEAAAPAEPKAPGILGPAGPLFASANPLARSSLASSGTGKTNSSLVNQFVETAADFNISGSNDKVQASRFASLLSNSIQKSQPFAEFFSSDLSVNGADILIDHFDESITAALADRQAIGPLKVMQKLAPGGKQSKWSVLPLVSNDAMADKEINDPSEVPAVILTTADYQHRKGIIDKEVPWAMPVVDLHKAYKKAYADKPQWIAAIAPYF